MAPELARTLDIDTLTLGRGSFMTIFVFGSNMAGKHYGGAARYAHVKFGAEMGVGEGITGKAYALPTMSEDLEPLPLDVIRVAVERFQSFALSHPQLNFYVTRVGCGIAGFSDAEIAPLFSGSPNNCMFDSQWSSYGLPVWKEVL